MSFGNADTASAGADRSGKVDHVEEGVWTCGTPDRPLSQRSVSGVSERERLARYCESHIDSPNFRVHYSVKPGYVETPGVARDVFAVEGLAYVACGEAGLQIIDISDPPDPVIIASVLAPGPAERVIVSGSLAFVIDGEPGLQIFDVSAPADPLPVARPSLDTAARAAFPSGDLLFAVDTDQLAIFDLSDPWNVEQIGTQSLEGTLSDLAVRESIAFVGSSEGLIVIDVADPASPSILSTLRTDRGIRSLALADSVLCFVDGSSSVGFIDVGEPASPVLVTTSEIDHQADRITVAGSVAYVTGSASISGLDFSRLPYPVGHGTPRTLTGPAGGCSISGEHLFVAVEGLGVRTIDLFDDRFRVLNDRIRDWPDTAYRDGIAEALEVCLAVFRDSLSARLPLTDGENGGGTDLIDLYVFDIERAGVGGWMAGEVAEESECTGGLSGYIAVDNILMRNVWRANPILAHELFHLVTIAYAPQRNPWLLESTAVWAQDVVWPGRAASNSAATWFQTPYQSFWSWIPRGRVYGSAHFWEFLEETTDRSIVTDLFERLCPIVSDWLEPLRVELVERGVDLDRSLAQFALWNHATGDRHDGRHYRRDRLPGITVQRTHDTYPVVGETVPVDMLAAEAGSNYIRFSGFGRTGVLRIHFDGDPAARDSRLVSFVTTRDSTVHTERTVTLDEAGDCEFIVQDWPDIDDVTMIVSNFTNPSGSLEFRYSAEEPEGTPIAEILTAPVNPFVGTTEVRFRLIESGPVSWSIFDVTGRRVREIRSDDLGPGEHTLTWDGKMENGRAAPSGVYPYRLRLGSLLHIDRLVRLASGSR